MAILQKDLTPYDLFILISVYSILLKECSADASWTNFALCPSCTNNRLVVGGNLFAPRLIGKGTSLIWARIDCSHSCANQDSCHAFNFYENENFYVCELLSDNLRRNKTVLQLIAQPGCSVWEKASAAVTESSTGTSLQPSTERTSTSTETALGLSTGMALSTTVSKPLPCADLRPGCLGTYPNCTSCIKTCSDYTRRPDLKSPQVYLCPDGNRLNSTPIRAECNWDSTILIQRRINLTTGIEEVNDVMALIDMHRLIKLGVYPFLRFEFQTSDVPNSTSVTQRHISDYTNFSISPNGTLSSLTYYKSSLSNVDIFNLTGLPMKPTPFVNVTDDRYGCGSFWLLDATNATYCPGGALGMFGPLRTNGSLVVNTGIRIPAKPNSFTFFLRVMLMSS